MSDLRFITEITRLILDGDLDAADQVATYMREEAIPGHERARLLVDAATGRQRTDEH